MNLLFPLLMMFSPFPSTTVIDTATPPRDEDVGAWHDRRIRNLRRDYGWLTLVALDWLKDGSNEIPNVGTVVLKSGTLTLHIVSDLEASVNGKHFSSGLIAAEGENTPADTVKIGSRAFIVIRRGDRFALRMWDKEAKRRKEFSDIERYPVSNEWRIEALWQPYDPPKEIKVPTVIAGLDEDYPVPGVALFVIKGKQYRLEPVLEEPNGDYFFIFGDKTNGKDTYGSGRFLYSKPAVDGKVVLDFNKAYNPPCAFTDFATCPLPPKGNKLPIRVEAGEKKYSH